MVFLALIKEQCAGMCPGLGEESGGYIKVFFNLMGYPIRTNKEEHRSMVTCYVVAMETSCTVCNVSFGTYIRRLTHC